MGSGFNCSLGTFGLFVQVGNLGGQIRHSETELKVTNKQDDHENYDNGEKEQNDEDDDD